MPGSLHLLGATEVGRYLVLTGQRLPPTDRRSSCQLEALRRKLEQPTEWPSDGADRGLHHLLHHLRHHLLQHLANEILPDAVEHRRLNLALFSVASEQYLPISLMLSFGFLLNRAIFSDRLRAHLSL